MYLGPELGDGLHWKHIHTGYLLQSVEVYKKRVWSWRANREKFRTFHNLLVATCECLDRGVLRVKQNNRRSWPASARVDKRGRLHLAIFWTSICFRVHPLANHIWPRHIQIQQLLHGTASRGDNYWTVNLQYLGLGRRCWRSLRWIIFGHRVDFSSFDSLCVAIITVEWDFSFPLEQTINEGLCDSWG